MGNINKALFDRNAISESQFNFLESIRTEKLISVYYELRFLLYTGILLFTGGVSYLAYEHFGNIAHVCAMVAIAAGIVIGFRFIGKFAKPYSNRQVTVDQPYFDYILLLVALLIISLFVYFQVYFDLVTLLVRWTSLVSAAILFTMAYRYDNRALLSMGITAFAATVGISLTPVDWVQGDWNRSVDLNLVCIILGLVFLLAGHLSATKFIKPHFRFTYVNFGLLLFYFGSLSGMFDSGFQEVYELILLISAALISFQTWRLKEFLFFLYSNIAGYIAITYFVYDFLDSTDAAIALIYYFPLSCIAYIMFLMKKRKHFANE
ncbi:MAG TPA: hypothetical protein VFW78_08570 [Bacteroidia bacterium]|nr:hypothetical protein [Bacteroidia bacterium]